MRKFNLLPAAAAISALGAMTPAELAAGRYMRGPDHPPAPGRGGSRPDDPPAPPGAGGKGPKEKTADELLTELKTELSGATDKVKEIAEEAIGKAKTSEELSRATKASADELLVKMNALTEQVSELEQAGQRKPGTGGDQAKSLGEQFAESEGFEELSKSAGQRGKAEMQLKATITSSTAAAAGSAGAAVDPERLPGIQRLPDRSLFIQDLIAPGRMSGSSIEYVRETGYTNAAAPVAEGALKPQSDIQLELVATQARVIAHNMKASRQILDDAAQVASLADYRLMYGLRFVLEAQILTGDGTGQNLLGIIPQATAYAAPAGVVAASTSIDVLRISMLQAVLAEFPASAHVLHPIDWANIEMEKDADGNYIIGQPQGTAAPRLWGLPVVASQSMTVGNFLTGAFSMGAQFFDRWLARLEIATENEDDFVKNLVTMQAELRGALAVYRPEAFITGALAVGP